MKIIILPGNPPSHYHYNLWMSELAIHFPNDSFNYIDYLLPQITHTSQESLNKMREDVERKIEGISDGEETIVIAHSFGAYFLENMLSRPNYHFILIFPFLGAPSSSGKRKLDLAFYFQPLYNFKLVQSTFHFALKIFMPEARKITKKELTKGVKTAAIEREMLRDTIPWKATHFSNNATLIFNPKDQWSPMTTTTYLKKIMKTITTDISHDFVLDSTQRNLMSQTLKSLLHKDH